MPKVRQNSSSVWHQFVIRCNQRDSLINFLKSKGVGTIIHYPIPPHLSEAYQYLNIGQDVLPITEHYANSVLSIPMYAGISEEEQAYVIENINAFT